MRGIRTMRFNFTHRKKFRFTLMWLCIVIEASPRDSRLFLRLAIYMSKGPIGAIGKIKEPWKPAHGPVCRAKSVSTCPDDCLFIPAPEVSPAFPGLVNSAYAWRRALIFRSSDSHVSITCSAINLSVRLATDSESPNISLQC
jgi:hypothetical protein